MENASKALLIAGAILVVILLIAVGMMVYNSATGTINKAVASMSSTEKQIHNSQFEQYLGDSISGANVKGLLSKVISNNSGDDNVAVIINEKTGENDLSNLMNSIQTKASVKYKVTATYSSGVITEIKIEGGNLLAATV